MNGIGQLQPLIENFQQGLEGYFWDPGFDENTGNRENDKYLNGIQDLRAPGK